VNGNYYLGKYSFRVYLVRGQEDVAANICSPTFLISLKSLTVIFRLTDVLLFAAIILSRVECKRNDPRARSDSAKS